MSRFGRWSRAGVALAVLAGGACYVPPAASPPVPPASPPAEPLSIHMGAHFADVLSLLDAVVVGGVSDVRSVAAEFIARSRARPAQAQWQPRIEAMLAYADQAAHAPDIAAAAGAVAMLSARCGACHRAEGATLKYRTGRQPHATSQMLRYRFAVDRMWEGLVGPSDARWQQGAELYATTVTCGPPGGGAPAQSHHREPCNSVLAIAGTARAAKTDAARADVFAAVARSCAGCHTVPPSDVHAVTASASASRP